MIALLSLALAGPVPVSASGAVFEGRRIAVVIGVQDYADPALQDLQYARKDAMDMANALSSPDFGGFDRVFVVDQQELTTGAALEKTLQMATADLNRDDTFLLYFSGHGTLTLDPLEGSRLWFLPSDALLNDPEHTGLAVDDIETWVASLPARRRVLIMDTCHNGRQGSKSSVNASTDVLLRGFRGDTPAPRSVQEISESEARLFAAEYQQPAMEDGNLQNGVYTHFLLEAMTTAADDADLNRDSLVDIAEAHQYARDHTIAYTGGIQVPRAEYRIVGREEIYLAGRKADRSAAEAALISACDLLLNQARLLVNGTPRGVLPGLYAIEPGTQLIEVQTADGRRLLRERVHFSAGTTLPIESLMQQRAASLNLLLGAGWSSSPALPAPSASLGLIWARPFPTRSHFRPDIHLNLDYGHGAVGDSTDLIDGGQLGLGLTTAWSVAQGYIGPSLDLRVPWRQNSVTGEQQAGLAPAAGLSAGLGWSLSESLSLQARLDGWGTAIPYADAYQPAWGLRLSVGVGRGVKPATMAR